MREASFAPISLSEIDIHIDDNGNLIIIDFADSRTLPLDADMDEAADGDVTVQTAIFHFSYITLSILTWEESECGWYATPPGSDNGDDPFALK